MTSPKRVKEIPAIINPDGSVYPFMAIFDPKNEEDDLIDAICEALEKKNRRLGTYYEVTLQ